MAGLVPAIHVLDVNKRSKNVDARDKPGHDSRWVLRQRKITGALGYWIPAFAGMTARI